MSSKVIYLKHHGMMDEQRDKIAMEIASRGYVVDAFASVICVNGRDGGESGVMPISEKEAEEVIKPYLELKEDDRSPTSVRIDVTWL